MDWERGAENSNILWKMNMQVNGFWSRSRASAVGYTRFLTQVQRLTSGCAAKGESGWRQLVCGRHLWFSQSGLSTLPLFSTQILFLFFILVLCVYWQCLFSLHTSAICLLVVSCCVLCVWICWDLCSWSRHLYCWLHWCCQYITVYDQFCLGSC